MLLITGATGFLGNHLRQNLSLPYLGLSTRSSVDEHILTADMRDQVQLHTIIQKHHISQVIHLAAITYNTSDKNFQGNQQMMQNLVNVCKPQNIPLIYVSTFAATYKNDPYASSKRDAESILRASQLPYLILRPTMILGPQSKDLALFQKLARYNILPLINGGNQKIQPIDVQSMIQMLLHFQKSVLPNKTYILSGDKVITTRSLLKSLNQDLHIINVPTFIIQNSISKLFPKIYELGKTFTNDLLPENMPIQIKQKLHLFDSYAYEIN